MMKCILAVPTYNGNNLWKDTVEAIVKFIPPQVLVHVVDSGSIDQTLQISKNSGFKTTSISSSDFNHGGTRNFCVNEFIEDYDIAIFLTQDAVPQEGFLEKIIEAFNDPSVACAYGRQIPHYDANPIAQHARAFNYPQKSTINDLSSVPTVGLKSIFMSNSFSAYRLSVFKELGGFPSDTILCEDMFYTAKALNAGYKSAYVSDAIVRHSHNYTPLEEFRRYFDIGVFHVDNQWIQKEFGGAGGAGKKFIYSELNFLIKGNVHWIPLAMINNFMKITGYKLGKNYQKLNKNIVRKFSMHKRYWN